MRHPAILKLEIEIHMTTTAEAQAIVDAIKALPAQFAAAEQSQIDAATAALQSQVDAANAALAQEKQDHADDLAALKDAAAAAVPETSGPGA